MRPSQLPPVDSSAKWRIKAFVILKICLVRSFYANPSNIHLLITKAIICRVCQKNTNAFFARIQLLVVEK